MFTDHFAILFYKMPIQKFHPVLKFGLSIFLLPGGSSLYILDINVLQPKTTRNTSVIGQIGFVVHCSKGEHKSWRTMGYLSKQVLEKTL